MENINFGVPYCTTSSIHVLKPLYMFKLLTVRSSFPCDQSPCHTDT